MDERRELPEATRNVGRVLKSSVKLVGLHFPEISALTAADFPLGRLHNVVIAPKRSGDRGRKQPLSPPKAQQTKTNTSKAVPGAGAGEATATAPGGGEGDEPVPCAAEGAAAKACDRCACACQAGDVWVAYRTLRKRYHALKDQADVEEVRVKVEDRRRELQAEFDTRRGEMEMELEQKRRELMESGQRLARARVELEEKRKELLESSHGLSEVGERAIEKGYKTGELVVCEWWLVVLVVVGVGVDWCWWWSVVVAVVVVGVGVGVDVRVDFDVGVDVGGGIGIGALRGELSRKSVGVRRVELEEKGEELLESSHGMSEAEVQSLRGIVQASLKECQKVQQESAELREKVLVGQQCLERALQDALSAREEIARRKHHGQILLARIRYLKSEDEPDESDHNNGDADNGDNVISNDNASDSDVGRTAGSTSDEDSDVIGSAPAPPPPAYNDVSAFFDDSEADDDDDATISVRVRRGWTEASNLDEATAGREGADGRPKSWFLEKERENLTREINRLSAELAAAGVSGLDDDESRLSDLDDSRPDIAAPIPPPPPPPPVAARSSKHSKKEPRGGGIPAPRRHANINPVADNNINSSSSSHRNEGSSSNHNSNSNSNSNNHHANGYNGGDGGGGSGDRGGGGGSYGSYGMRPAFPDGAQRRRRRFDHRPGGGGEPHRSGVEPARATGGFERPAKSGRAPPPLPLLPQHRHPQHPPSSSSAYPNHPGAYPGNHLGTYPEAYLGSYPGYRGSGFPDEDDDGGGVTGSDMSLSPRSSRRGNGRGNSRGIRYRRG
eukprot:jgi/Undpi1/974/HiC_scaffold_10.g04438.m1